MDLSHWDLASSFFLKEAASLASGVDPNTEDIRPEAKQRRALILREMTAADSEALMAAIKWVDGPPGMEEVEPPKYLVSIELRQQIASVCKDGSYTLGRGFLEEYSATNNQFDRETIRQWFEWRGFIPAYPFNPIPRGQRIATQEGTPAAQEQLHPRLKNNYLRLILALAMSGVPNFDPRKPYEAARALLDHLDIELDEKTVAGYITDAFELQSRERT